MKIRQFLKKKKIETSEDLKLQMELFAYIIAKHYNISLTEVYQMSDDVFRQSLSWALAINEEEEKAREREEAQSSTNNEVVSFDYSWLEQEDF